MLFIVYKEPGILKNILAMEGTMEVKRLYDRERKLMRTLIILAIIIILAGIFLIITIRKDSFKDYLINKDYYKLYTFIENPDFSFDIFNTYMDYNYGGDIDIINTEKDENYIKYDIKTDVGEKTILLQEQKGKSIWVFNDYIYDWHIKIPPKANISIGTIQLENKGGEVILDKLPFAVYPINISSQYYEAYNEKVMAGQKINIKMNIASDTMKICEEVVNEYLNFKKDAINLGVINEVNCVEKGSGIYKEVMEEMEWLKNVDYKVSRELISILPEKCIVDDDGIICLEVIETWDTTIINGNGENITTDKYKNNYFIDPEENFEIVKIKNEQIY